MTDPCAANILKKVEEEKVWNDDIMDSLQDQFDELDVQGIGAEVFELLVNATSGDDLQIVRAVEDSGGFEAWWRLIHERGPRSVARAVRLVGMVTSPPKVMDLAKVEAEIVRWEEHQRTLRREFKEGFSDVVRIGILLNMLPQSVQDFAPPVHGRRGSLRGHG